MATRTGRPPSDDPHSEVVTIRLTKSIKRLAEEAAARDGDKIGPWMRRRLEAAVTRSAQRHRRATQVASNRDPDCQLPPSEPDTAP